MIEIDEPPDIAACSTYAVPLVWLWSARAGKWKSFEPIDGDLDLIRRHRCERHGDPNPSWRQVTIQDPETIHAGAERVRSELKNASKESAADG